jgi:hypothetical protein
LLLPSEMLAVPVILAIVSIVRPPFTGRRAGLGLIRNADVGAIAESIGPIGHHTITGIEARVDGEETAVLGPEFNRVHRHHIALTEEVHIGTWRAALHGRNRHGDDVFLGVEIQDNVDELVREQALIIIVEGGT